MYALPYVAANLETHWQVVTLPSLSVIYLSLRDKHAALITQVSSPSLHELMSMNIHSFHAHFSIGTLCLLKSISSTRCLQASQLIWLTKPWHSGGKGRRPLLDICRRTEEEHCNFNFHTFTAHQHSQLCKCCTNCCKDVHLSIGLSVWTSHTCWVGWIHGFICIQFWLPHRYYSWHLMIWPV